jgi:hypothetical protein
MLPPTYDDPYSVALTRYFLANGSTTRTVPCPGFACSRVRSSSRDSKSVTSRLTDLRSRFTLAARPETVVVDLPCPTRTTWRTRTRSFESTRRSSAGSSKVSRISSGSFSPRSSFAARLRDRLKKSADPPVLSTALLTLVIFVPPQFHHFIVDVGKAVFHHGAILRPPSFFLLPGVPAERQGISPSTCTASSPLCASPSIAASVQARRTCPS